MNDAMARKLFDTFIHRVTDLMKLHTRPFVAIMAGAEIGTGTFIERAGTKALTCAHVAAFNPDAHYVDPTGSTVIHPGIWCTELDHTVDAAFAPIADGEWNKIAARARQLSMARFAQRHEPVASELLFFRGIAGENAPYVGSFGARAILSGYCSQEKQGSGDSNIFEMLWKPGGATVTAGTSEEARNQVMYDDPAGFSGSLVWNTRFVESGCDLTKWTPDDAVVTGLLRRYDEATGTLLAWRVEHLLAWL
ncbi:hypothetical protein ACE103_01280 [Bradyrhizobium sp. ma5]|uniref:hypothetical protein n=1 Tax=Bradyrhizobium sp. ma5 TaxID=3344828 RepID=UPI0035D52A3D